MSCSSSFPSEVSHVLERSRAVLAVAVAHVRRRTHRALSRGYRGSEVLGTEGVHGALKVLEARWPHLMFRGHHGGGSVISELSHLLAGHAAMEAKFARMFTGHVSMFFEFVKLGTVRIRACPAIFTGAAGLFILLPVHLGEGISAPEERGEGECNEYVHGSNSLAFLKV